MAPFQKDQFEGALSGVYALTLAENVSQERPRFFFNSEGLILTDFQQPDW